MWWRHGLLLLIKLMRTSGTSMISTKMLWEIQGISLHPPQIALKFPYQCMAALFGCKCLANIPSLDYKWLTLPLFLHLPSISFFSNAAELAAEMAAEMAAELAEELVVEWVPILSIV